MYAGDASYPQVKSDRETVFSHLDGLFENARVLAARVESLADTLAGQVPEANADKAMPPHAGGLLGALEVEIERVRGRIADAMEAVSRIERRLP